MSDEDRPKTYTMEKIIRVIDDVNSERFELSQDADGVYLLEMRNYAPDNTVSQIFIMPLAVARLVCKAMPEMIDYIEEMEREDDKRYSVQSQNNEHEHQDFL